MVAVKHQRRVFLWKLTADVIPKEAPVSAKVSEIIGLIEQLYRDGQGFIILDQDSKFVDDGYAPGKKNCIYMADFKIAGQYAIILINRGDPDAVHPSFLNLENSKVTTVNPDDDQVQGWSAHLVVDMNSKMGSHKACFESMTNVSPTLVQRYIDVLVRKACHLYGSYSYDRPIKRGKRVVVENKLYRPVLVIDKPISSSLAEDIERGVLSSIILRRPCESYHGAGDPTMVEHAEEQLVLRARSADSQRAQQWAQDVFGWGKSAGYATAEVRIRNLPGNSSANPRFDLENADAKELLYSRSRILGQFKKELQACYEKVDSEIVGNMIAEIERRENW